MMKKKLFALLVIIVLLSSCGNYYEMFNSGQNEYDFSNVSKLDTQNNSYGEWQQNHIGYYSIKRLQLNYKTIVTQGLSNFVICTDNILWSLSFGANSLIADENQSSKIMNDIDLIATGFNHNLVIKTDGNLWAWGDNSRGQLGNGTTQNRRIAEPIKIMEEVVLVTAGNLTSFALQADGSLWGWGNAHSGQLGVEISAELNERHRIQSTPVKIMEDVSSVATGVFHSMAIRTDGSLWSWGGNFAGVIGNGKETTFIDFEIKEDNDATIPIKIMENIVYIAAGWQTSFAIDSYGVLWGWGSNSFGQLGDGTTKNRLAPVKIMDDVISVSAGFAHTLALKSDGSLWAWGENRFGEIGDGTEKIRLKPVKIMYNVVVIETGLSAGPTDYDFDGTSTSAGRSFAIRTNGSLWGWGLMHHGENGKSLIPIEITYDMLMP